ncbi:MAG: hypothetical protein P1Q69_00280 [Candidatus Thorarchaeota archaeon]|nr:hypothetical protein [Candidatus Thorarchaeota archaeon]
MSRSSVLANMILGVGLLGIAGLILVGFQYTPLLMTVVALSTFVTFGLNYWYLRRLIRLGNVKESSKVRTLINSSSPIIYIAAMPFTFEFGEFVYLWVLGLIVCVLGIPTIAGVLGIILATPSEQTEIIESS